MDKPYNTKLLKTNMLANMDERNKNCSRVQTSMVALNLAHKKRESMCVCMTACLLAHLYQSVWRDENRRHHMMLCLHPPPASTTGIEKRKNGSNVLPNAISKRTDISQSAQTQNKQLRKIKSAARGQAQVTETPLVHQASWQTSNNVPTTKHNFTIWQHQKVKRVACMHVQK